MGSNGLEELQVHVQSVDSVSPSGRTPRALEGMLMPTTDESGTQISSSSGSAKPPSLDGKSVTSGTTFALDEKESLRPDDSASVKATDDEDALHGSSGMPDSRTGSDDGVQAFRDQLREISSMESRPPGPPQSFGHTVNPTPGVLYVPPPGSGVGIVPGPNRAAPVVDPIVDFPPDSKLLEALDSPKDRIMVLKLEQDIVDFVKDPKESSLKLPQTNAFYRMLAHKLADYYMLGHTVDEFTQAVRIFKTPQCRLPPPLTGVATPSTAASTPPPIGPQMKILRRGAERSGPTIANGSNTPSKTTSENDESGNDDEKRTKAPTTREEREARYEAARKRIMGSAKPLESPEQTLDQDISRSSSAAGKKGTRRKQRSDSDDDFEARSAFSAYYPGNFSAGAPTPPSFGFANPDSQSSQFPTNPYGPQAPAGSYQQYGVPGSSHWPNHGFHANNGQQNWMPGQQQPYSLSNDFQRTMSFQPPVGNHAPNMQPTYNTPYAPPFPQPQQAPWPPQHSYMPNYASQPGQTYGPVYPAGNHPVPNALQDGQTYAYGQLPSQTFPGRPPSKLEHPLPGSYKSKHFNPQSQAFVPAHGGTAGSPFPSPAAPMGSVPYGAGYGMPGPLQRQNSTPSQNAAFGSPRGPAQPMMHPLPQPVFPRQASPNVPLPPKPDGTPSWPGDRHNSVSSVTNGMPNQNQHQSSIAKWGAPASLPAKPPPPAELMDAAKGAQAQPQPVNGTGRVVNAMPSFGSMPPMASGYNAGAQGVPSPRRV